MTVAPDVRSAEGRLPALAASLNSSLTIDVKTTASVLNLGLNQTYEAIKRGEIEAIRLGGRWLVLTRPLLALLGADTHH